MHKRERLQLLHVYRLLPRTNCKECGVEGCMAFAFALISRERRPRDCPYLSPPSLQLLEGVFWEGEVEETGLLINKEKCNGCGDCVVVCNRARMDTRPVLQVIDGVIKVINWSGCRRKMEPPIFCRVCEEKCPFAALELVK